jgi:hypothetical protein
MAIAGARRFGDGAIEQTLLPPSTQQTIPRELAAAALIGIGATMGLLAVWGGWSRS